MLAALVIVIFPMVSPAAAPSATDALKGPIERAIALLKDPRYQAPSMSETQREDIWAAVKDIFDFREISMRSLAQDWRNFDDKQREEFIEVFATLLKNTYVGKLQGEYHNEEVAFVGQDDVAADKAVVKSNVLRGNIQIPMHYSMVLKDGAWRIYDINIEGISLVKNYRGQFKEFLSKDTPAALIARLREKNESQRKERLEKGN